MLSHFTSNARAIPFAPVCAIVKVLSSAFTITPVHTYYVLIV